MSTMFLTTHGTAGDVLPFLRLAAALRDRGHDVTLLTHERFVAAARRQGITGVPIDTEEEYQRHLADAGDVLLAQTGSYDPAELLAYYRRHRLFERVRAEYDVMVQRHVPGDTVLVGRHTSGLSALMAAETTGAPAAWIALTPTQVTAMPVMGFIHQRVLAGPINRMRVGAGLPVVRDWTAWLGSANVQLGLWPAWFDPDGTAGELARPVGFLLNDEDESGALDPTLDALLTRGPAPVLVSASTGRMTREGFLTAAVHGALAAGREVVVSTARRDLLPPQLPVGVHWYPWLPFRTVLPRVAAIVHQGGIGTLGRSVGSGVPQLILGYGYDQPDNGARLQRCGAGAFLPAARWSESEVSAALRILLNTPPDLAAKQRDVRETPTAAVVVDELEGLLRPAPAGLAVTSGGAR